MESTRKEQIQNRKLYSNTWEYDFSDTMSVPIGILYNKNVLLVRFDVG